MARYPGQVTPWEPTARVAEDPPMPVWFWLLALFGLCAWWPLQPFWASDDFLALNYAEVLPRAMSDFAGPQYGATDIWFFYRPLITLSFWLDAMLAGGEPFFSHLSNALAHGASSLLVGLIWLRFLPPTAAFGAGLLWATAPSHAGSILWAVGRVDSHTTMWCLLSIWFLCRYQERESNTRIWSWLAFLAALGSKELAWVVPGLALLLCMARPRVGNMEEETPRVIDRIAEGARGSWPYFLILGIYFAFRWQVLGRLVGGYQAAAFNPEPMVRGFGETTLNLLDPMRYGGAAERQEWIGALPDWLPWVGLLPAGIGLCVLLARRRFGFLLLVLLAYVGSSIPMAPFWSAPDIHNLRYYYLPLCALVGLIAAGGWPACLLGLLVWASPFVDIRTDYLEADHNDATMHRALQRELPGRSEDMWFVAGLPHQNPAGTVVSFHFGVDRMLASPFGPGDLHLFALRPIVELPQAFRLDVEDGVPFALPEGTTWFFDGPDILGRAPERSLPNLEVRLDGLQTFSSVELQELKNGAMEARIVMPGGRAPGYRVTIFTAMGYLCALWPDDGAEGEVDGVIDMLRFFKEARYASGGDFYVLRGLEIPATVDLETRFPVLVEAGEIAEVGGTAVFEATHRARQFLWFEFDRGLPAFVRGALGLGQ